MNQAILKLLDGRPRVFPVPSEWHTAHEWYQNLLEEVRKIEEVSETG